MSLTFFVHGTPAPQGSKRHVGGGRLVESSKTLPAWRTAVTDAARAAWQGRAPIDTPVAVALTIYLPRPKRSRFKVYPAGPPDTDKLQRAVGDALTASGVIRDDARIVHWDAWKIWHSEAIPPGAHITITELEDTQC